MASKASTSHQTMASKASTSHQPIWTDSETQVLINAWGGTYLRLNRGDLHLHSWKVIADFVNSFNRMINYLNTPRTPNQCRDRVEALREIFETERAKIQTGGGVYVSHWKFYSSVEHLFGTTNASLNSTGTVENRRAKKRKSSGGLGCVAKAVKGLGELMQRVETEKAEGLVELEKYQKAISIDLEKERKRLLADMVDKVKQNKVTMRRGQGGSDRGKAPGSGSGKP